MSGLDEYHRRRLIETRSKQNSQKKEAIRELGVKIDGAMNRLSGQMQGIEVSQQAAIEAGGPHREFTKVLEQQNIAFAAFLKSCTAALPSTSQSTGNTFKYARAFGDARQLIGTIGDVRGGWPTNTFDVLIAQDRSKQMAGSIDGKLALDFMNAALVKTGGSGSANSKLSRPEMTS